MAFFKLNTWILFAASTVIGIGAALLWTGQGNYLTVNSTSELMTRNSGIFWSLRQLRYCVLFVHLITSYKVFFWNNSLINIF